MRLGDAIAIIAEPIATGVDAVFGTQIKGCGGCNKMKQNLNAGMSVTNAVYERWFKAKQEGEKMKYQMTVIVEADLLSEVAAKGESIGEVLSVQVRPEPQQQPAMRPGQQPR